MHLAVQNDSSLSCMMNIDAMHKRAPSFELGVTPPPKGKWVSRNQNRARFRSPGGPKPTGEPSPVRALGFPWRDFQAALAALSRQPGTGEAGGAGPERADGLLAAWQQAVAKKASETAPRPYPVRF